MDTEVQQDEGEEDVKETQSENASKEHNEDSGVEQVEGKKDA